jgi:hypothetical protein
MTTLDQVFISQYKEADFEGRVATQLRSLLRKIPIDTYNRTYVLHLTLHVVDEPPEEDEDG